MDTFSGPVVVADDDDDDDALARVRPVLGEKADTVPHGHDWMFTKIARAPIRIRKDGREVWFVTYYVGF